MNTDKYIKQYIERFGGYPVFYMRGFSDEKVIGMIKQALRTGIPIRPIFKKGCVY